MILDAAIDGRSYRVEIKGTAEAPRVLIEGKAIDCSALWISSHVVHLLVDGRSHDLGIVGEPGGYRVGAPRRSYVVGLSAAGTGEPVARKPSSSPAAVRAPMPGKIVRLLAREGEHVAEGESLLVMEAMKMENEIRSPRAGVVRGVSVREGQAVESGATLCVLD